MRRVFIALTAAALVATSRVGAQQASEEVRIVAAGVDYMRAKLSRTEAARPRAIVIDFDVQEALAGARREERERAIEVAGLTGIRAASSEETLRCGDNVPGLCQLDADLFLTFSGATVAGDSATVRVSAVQSRPTAPRDPKMFWYGLQLTLRRTAGKWVVIGEDLLYIS